MIVSRDQNAGRSYDKKSILVPFERWKSSIFGKTLTNQNSIQEEIKSGLKAQNACYRSV